VLERDGYICRCKHCRRADHSRVLVATEVDHVIPKAKGGTDALDNLQAINAQCHRRKSCEDSGRTWLDQSEIGADGWPIDANRW